MKMPSLPLHPTRRYPSQHPLAGLALQAVGVLDSGRIVWPVMGAAEDGDGGGEGGDGDGGDGGRDGGDGKKAGDKNGGAGGGKDNATDGQSNDLGYPANTPIGEMNDKQQAAYWRHASRKHEGRFKGLVGDRSAEDVKKDLDAYAELKKAEQTPAEQALTEAREAGKAEAVQESNHKAATAIFRASLKAQGHDQSDIDDLVDNFNVANFVTDGEVDTDKLATFAQRFNPAGTANDNDRRRDFGGGRRREGREARGSAGKAEAERRFKKTTANAD